MSAPEWHEAKRRLLAEQSRAIPANDNRKRSTSVEAIATAVLVVCTISVLLSVLVVTLALAVWS